ncbi:MAG: hypothetical protein ACYTG1_09315 [Planctomycetota bacterium]|jgi:hypothetical protein
MEPTIANAFTDTDGSRRPSPRASLTGMLSAMRADLESTHPGWRLRLRPMRALDVAAAWPAMAGDATHVLLLPDGGRDRATTSVDVMAARLGVAVLERFGEGCVVLDVDALGQLAALADLVGCTAVGVDGPVERRDAEAIALALRAGRSALAVEMRATLAVRFGPARTVTVDTRHRGRALRFVAETFRHYVAALRRRPVASIERPAITQLERLMGVSGAIAVRPIETRMFATSIDIGISTEGEPTGPADCSLVYDIPSDTWHDEE